MGPPSSPRKPPSVLTMTYSGPCNWAELHPIPTFCVRPKRSPLGASRSISGVKGSAPVGPSPTIRPAATESAEPNRDSRGGGAGFRCILKAWRGDEGIASAAGRSRLALARTGDAMELDGHNLVGDRPTRESATVFRAANAATGLALEPAFHE